MKKLITELDIVNFHSKGGTILPLGENEIITPLALDKAKYLKIKIIKKEEAGKLAESELSISVHSRAKRIAVASDHTGFRLKNIITKFLSEKGYEIVDVGTYDENSCDYPDFAYAAALKVKNMEADFAVILDATGIPSAITANKLRGIRAATCYNEFTARSSREHNNANVLVMGAKTLGEESVKSIINAWLETGFGGGRHQKRLNKINTIENENLK